MKMPFRTVSCGCFFVLAVAVASAADISRLEWGSYIVDTDSSNGLSDWKTVTSDDGHTISMTFSSLEAKADGATMEATANLTGHYNITQPGYDVFSSLHVELQGHVIKSPSSAARLVVKIGSSEQTIEWPPGSSASEPFSRAIDIPVQVDSRLPNPFEVSAGLYARKDGPIDAVYISLETMKITAENPKVAAR